MTSGRLRGWIGDRHRQPVRHFWVEISLDKVLDGLSSEGIDVFLARVTRREDDQMLRPPEVLTDHLTAVVHSCDQARDRFVTKTEDHISHSSAQLWIVGLVRKQHGQAICSEGVPLTVRDGLRHLEALGSVVGSEDICDRCSTPAVDVRIRREPVLEPKEKERCDPTSDVVVVDYPAEILEDSLFEFLH